MFSTLQFNAVRLVSSANKRTSSDLQASGKSLIYIKKSNGPSMEPCGTPYFIVCQFEDTPFVSTRWILFVRYECNQFKAFPLNPYFSIFWSNTLWSSVSKAFSRSRKKVNLSFCLELRNFSVNSTSASIVLCFERKPNCFLYKTEKNVPYNCTFCFTWLAQISCSIQLA